MRTRYLFLLGLAGCLSAGLLAGCAEDEPEKTSGQQTEAVQRVQALASEGSLLLESEQEADGYRLYFETDTVWLPAADCAALTADPEKWKTTVVLADETVLDIPTLGKSLHLTDQIVKLNPTGYAPLSAQVTVTFPVQGRLKVRVKGKQGPETDATYVFKKYGYNHQQYIHGLYDNYENTIYVTLADPSGRERLTDSLLLRTPDILLPYQLPKMQTVVSEPARMEPGMTFVNYLGDNEYDTHRPYMLDCRGEVRWVLLLKGHPEIGNITAHTGFKRLPNGNFYCGDVKSSRLLEIDMLGNLVHSWDLKEKGYTFHHDVSVMPNGNFLATVSKDDSYSAAGVHTVFDYVVEVDAKTGAIVEEWDLKKSLDITRTVLIPTGDTVAVGGNWAHGNAVIYSPDDDCIVVSCRYQGIVKLNRDNQVKWLLSPHKGWNGSGLLKPLDAAGRPITDERVVTGQAAHDEFDWCWGSHDPVLMPDGHLLAFDNGFFRQYEDIDLYSTKGYSRAVEYEIDEGRGTVRQVWQYGKERGRACYGVAVSSVQYLPGTGNVLFCPGCGTPNVNGVGGRVVEVDYLTKEVVFEAHLSTPGYMAFHRCTRMPLYPEGR